MTTSSTPNPGDTPHAHPVSPAPAGPPRYTPAYGQGDQYGAGLYGQHRGPVPAPPQHRRLLTLTLVSAALYVLNGIVSMIATATTDLTGAYERLGVPADQAQAMADQSGGSTVFSLIILVIALGAYGLGYTGLKKGKNWARVLGIVLAILSIIGTVFGFVGSLIFGGWAIALIAIGVAVLIVDILWLITAFAKPVAAWFAQQH